jgi:hypothetical protein
MARLVRLLVVLSTLLAGLAAGAASAADAPSLSASAGQIAFGDSLTLRGTLPGGAGQQVELLSQTCGFTEPVTVATTTAAADGTYAFNLSPALTSTFLVQAGTLQSAGTTVPVQPLVQLRRGAADTFTVDVSVGAGQFFSKPVLLQRYDAKRRAWKKIASATLRQASDAGAIIAVSRATVHAKVARGSKIRAYVPQATLGQCYRPGASAPIAA